MKRVGSVDIPQEAFMAMLDQGRSTTPKMASPPKKIEKIFHFDGTRLAFLP